MLIDAERPDAYSAGAEPLAVIARPLGRQTNNFAEYTAVVLALERALELGAAEVEVVLDSKLAVEQLMGRWRVKEPTLAPLYARASELLRRFDKWSLRHEGRASNSAADALANLALDDPAAATSLEQRPPTRSASGTPAVGLVSTSRPVSWREFAHAAPELAAAGERLLRAFTVGYLATLRSDGAPRVHPVSISLADGALHVFIIAGSRRVTDLERDPRYALHAPRTPGDETWDDEEWEIEGLARRLTDPAEIERARRAHTDDSGPNDPGYELLVARAHWKTHAGGRVRIRRWPG